MERRWKRALLAGTAVYVVAGLPVECIGVAGLLRGVPWPDYAMIIWFGLPITALIVAFWLVWLTVRLLRRDGERSYWQAIVRAEVLLMADIAAEYGLGLLLPFHWGLLSCCVFSVPALLLATAAVLHTLGGRGCGTAADDFLRGGRALR